MEAHLREGGMEWEGKESKVMILKRIAMQPVLFGFDYPGKIKKRECDKLSQPDGLITIN